VRTCAAVGDQGAHLRVVEQGQHPPLDPQLGELNAILRMALLLEPQTEGIHRGDVRVARHWPHFAIAHRDDELLQRRLRRQRWHRVTDRGLIVFEGSAIPDEGAGCDVFQVSAFLEELIEQCGRRVVHASLLTLLEVHLVAEQQDGSSGWTRTSNPPVNSKTRRSRRWTQKHDGRSPSVRS